MPCRFPCTPIACLLTLLLGGCGGGSRSAPPPEPPAPLVVLAVSPAPGAEGVAADALTIHIDFSHPIDPGSVGPAAFFATVDGEVAPALVALEQSGTTLSAVLGGVLPPDAEIVFTLGELLRLGDGLALAPNARGPWSFHLAPAVEEVPLPAGDPGRYSPAVARLNDGRWLVIGGLGDDGVSRADAEVGSTNGFVWSPTTGALAAGRWKAGAGALVDGRVLVVGGFLDGAGTTASPTSEVFDPTTQTFSQGPSLTTARADFAFMRTSEGTLVAVGGCATEGGAAATDTLEVYDPALQQFVALEVHLPTPTTEAAVAALPAGGLLIAGGIDEAGALLEGAHVVLPEEGGTLESLASGPIVPRRSAAAVLAPTGRVYLFGGVGAGGFVLDSIERYDPASGTFTLLDATLAEPRSRAQVAVLSNGMIALVGGETVGSPGVSARVDVFDPSTDEIAASTLLQQGVTGAAVASLANGSLVVYGGAEDVARPPTTRDARLVLAPTALGAVVAAPRVVAWSPLPGAGNTDVDAHIDVRFSKAIDAATLANALLVMDAEGKAVSGTFALLSDDVTARFTPDAPLPVRQVMTLEVATTPTDLLGLPLLDDGARFSQFTTAYDLVVGAADDGSQFGYSATTGDVNGDGIDDLIASAYAAEAVPGTGQQPGQVYVLFGRAEWGPDAAPLYRDLATMPADLTITFETHADQPGIESALQVGDFDGDGYADILVGVHSADGPTEADGNRGEMFVVFGQAIFPAPMLALGTTAVAGFDILRVYGAATGDRFGEGMAMGDVDGDGVLDVLVGARFVDATGASNCGAVYVLFGASKAALGIANGFGSDQVGSATNQLVHMAVLGSDAGDNLGWSAAAGDLDDDGYADVVAGSTGGDGATNTAASSGEAVVIFGAARNMLVPTGMYREVRAGSASPLPGFVVHGADASDFLAWSLGAGDLNGDGHDDLCMGALLADGMGNTGSNRGEANVLFGGPRADFLPSMATWSSFVVGGAPPTASLRLHGEADGHSFGDCFAIADLDGDGYADLLVGDYQARGPLDGMGANVGEVSLLRGGTWLPTTGALEFDLRTDGASHPHGAVLTRFYGKAPVARFGTTLAAGDLNGDGRLDLVTGANRAKAMGRLFADGGEAYVLWGRAVWWK